MKTIVLFLTTAITALAQGPLTPPGAPAATMKTLDQIEPRTPIYSLPYVITTPGSYYLTGNLQFSNATGTAITIDAPNVTLDLMGFTLSSTAAVTGDAISNLSGHASTTIRNGCIVGTTTVSVSGTFPSRTWSTSQSGFASGVNIAGSYANVIDLRVSGCRYTGIGLFQNGNVTHCIVSQCGINGILLNEISNVSNCVVSLCGTRGIWATNSRIIDCSISDNALYGIAGSSGTITGCICRKNGGVGINASTSTITNCNASENISTGIDASGSTISQCAAIGNNAWGILAPSSSISFCRAASNASGQISSTGGTLTGNSP